MSGGIKHLAERALAGITEGGTAVPVAERGRGLTPFTLRLRLTFVLMGVDLTAFLLAFTLVEPLKTLVGSWFSIMAIAMPIYVGMAMGTKAYGGHALRARAGSLSAAVRAGVLTFAILFLISYFFRVEQQMSRVALACVMGLTIALIIVGRLTFRSVVARIWPTQIWRELVIVDGVDTAPVPGAQMIDAAAINLVPDLRDPAMFNRFAALLHGIDRVVVISTVERYQNWAMMLKGGHARGEIVVDTLGLFGAIGLGKLGQYDTVKVAAGPLDVQQRLLKRAFDLALCVPIIIALAPILILVSVAIKLDSPGPVFFRQRRIGRNNAYFDIVKFRSMHVAQADSQGARSTQRQDKRVTRVGRLIRKTSIDELPQLFNVLGGSMSLVGPRPHALGSLAGDRLFWDVDESYWHRHVLKPGITGLAQVRGLRGSTLLREDLTKRLQSDLEYASNWSLWRDIRILFMTFGVVVHHNSY